MGQPPTDRTATDPQRPGERQTPGPKPGPGPAPAPVEPSRGHHPPTGGRESEP